jgi:hypothetical protein
MSAPTICFDMSMTNLPGRRQATEVLESEDLDPARDLHSVTLELHGYNSAGTEPGVGCLLDVELSVTGEQLEKSEERPHGGYHRTEVAASMTRAQAVALRDQINVFLGLE